MSSEDEDAPLVPTLKKPSKAFPTKSPLKHAPRKLRVVVDSGSDDDNELRDAVIVKKKLVEDEREDDQTERPISASCGKENSPQRKRRMKGDDKVQESKEKAALGKKRGKISTEKALEMIAKDSDSESDSDVEEEMRRAEMSTHSTPSKRMHVLSKITTKEVKEVAKSFRNTKIKKPAPRLGKERGQAANNSSGSSDDDSEGCSSRNKANQEVPASGRKKRKAAASSEDLSDDDSQGASTKRRAPRQHKKGRTEVKKEDEDKGETSSEEPTESAIESDEEDKETKQGKKTAEVTQKGKEVKESTPKKLRKAKEGTKETTVSRKTTKEANSDGSSSLSSSEDEMKEEEGHDDDQPLAAIEKKVDRTTAKASAATKMDNDSSDEGVQEEKGEKSGGKPARTGRKKKSAIEDISPDERRLINLKAIAVKAGMRFAYKNLFNSVPDKARAKIRILEAEMAKRGFEPPYTKERAQKFRERKETEAELAELRKNRIISAANDNPRMRVTRSRRAAEEPSKRRRAAFDSASDEEEKDQNSDDCQEDEESSSDENPFANLKGIVSDEADSD